MESTLRKTLIKLQQGIELHFWKITKFNKFGCKAIFYDIETKNIYDVNVLSRSLLQLNNFVEEFKNNLIQFQRLKSNAFCPIVSITQDGDIIYIISQAQKHTLSDLIQKRDGLTEFQVIYFVLDLIELINFLKERNMFYQIIQMDEIYLNKNMKMVMPFSIWASLLKQPKPAALRSEDKKDYLPPEFLSKNSRIVIDQIYSWNVGIFIYELVQGVKPFSSNTELVFNHQVSLLVKDLVFNLLKKDPDERMKFPLIFIHNLFKKYPSLPHILPPTIFSCPPSNEYVSEYCKNFHEKNQQEESCGNKILNIRTAYYIQDQLNEQNEKQPVKSFKSFKYIKPSVRSMIETKSYITQFVDISHLYGFGYQMSSGLICFVFNDRSQMQFENSMKKTVTYITNKKVATTYPYEKIPEESDMKKKLYVLEAYTKSIKKYKHSNETSSKPITVSQYYKTNSAAVFMLSNQTIQIIFNDKIIFILTKHTVRVQNKNSDKFQPYENLIDTDDMKVRKNYALKMAEKLFHWDVSQLRNAKNRIDYQDRDFIFNQSQMNPRRNMIL